ncbi:3-deoxy-D-manno-octulosonate 8-phosphate phosphatase [Variovorax sp. PCZ-1]|uniref:KdsC family phosphatase n=1 Tax=Variovorax sp. PCZ-1 TaxID=2835533 RepID=UPI001BD13CE9|nr:3-deoxy-D-manno-octulosonate 8-phosphate phosphatase [Variovorax sp. PCZ-1]MBS7808667.1 3-deoxy-D-manno-octulosonate 8-phosphate phosphatase [Variovorax sp. PCZ-1]
MSPSLQFPAPLLLRAQPVRLVILDVDGVLTDGGLYFSEQGESLKRFSVLDGQGIKMLQHAGIALAVITGRDSAALRTRLSALKIKHAVFGTEDKLPAANKLLSELGLNWGQVAVMGDDWPDLPLLHRAQLASTPANGHHENRALAHFTSSNQGGSGAVRELCDLIACAQGHYAKFFEAAVQA